MKQIDFVLVGEKNRKFLKDVKVTPWELQDRCKGNKQKQRKVEESSEERANY